MKNQNYLPSNAKVYVFGKNRYNQGRYTGKLWYKINKLAEDIGEGVRANEDNFSPYNTGDHGLDIVGWIPFDKNTPGFITVFGQCACTPKWVDKQHETKSDRWTPVISFTAYPNNMIFIPYCFRNEFGKWHNKTCIHKSIVIDRLRFNKLLAKKEKQVHLALPHDFINPFLEQHEELF
jgi:hypothetical protein